MEDMNKFFRMNEGRILASTQAIARLFAVDKKTVAVWAKKGLPRVTTGWYDLQGCLEFKNIKNSEHGESLEQQKLKADLRYREARADNEELKQKVAIGEYIAVAEIEERLKETFAQVKTTLLAIGQKTMADIYNQYPEVAFDVKHTVEREIERGLAQLATGAKQTASGRYSKAKSK